MKDEYSIFSRSFSQHDQKKLGFGAFFLSFFITAFTICTVFKLPGLNLEGSMASGLKMLVRSGILDEQPKLYSEAKSTIHDFSNRKSDVYEINGDIRIHGLSATIYVGASANTSSWTINPYARKLDNIKIEPVREWKINNNHATGELPHCQQRFSVPAILFSTGAYSGNHFHSFTDILIPLYLTSLEFNRTVVFLITDDIHSWWRSKFQKITGKLSKYDIVNIDKENEILCFSRVILGLKGHKEFGIDPLIPPYYSMRDFRQFLRSTYSLERESVTKCRNNKRPRLLIISRVRRRRLRNEAEVAIMARKLGFEAVISEIGSNMSVVAQLVNSFDVMVGVHGAGLTNMIFLPENGVVIEIIPIALHELSMYYFGLPVKDMDLSYLEYNVTPNESSLSEYYSPDSKILRGPHKISYVGWVLFQSIFLTMQDVYVDLGSFKSTLSHAFKLVCG